MTTLKAQEDTFITKNRTNLSQSTKKKTIIPETTQQLTGNLRTVEEATAAATAAALMATESMEDDDADEMLANSGFARLSAIR